MTQTTPVMGTAQVAEKLRASTRTVMRLVASGELTPIQKLPGRTGSFLFDPVAVEALAADRRAASETDR